MNVTKSERSGPDTKRTRVSEEGEVSVGEGAQKGCEILLEGNI